MKPEFNATYSDWKLIKTRRVVQIVLEVPLEQSGHAYEVLGGMPRPDAEIWCGVARIEPGSEAVQPRQALPQPSGARPVRDWAQLTASEQSGIRCNEPAFWRFLNEQHGYAVNSKDEAARVVRIHCGVESRSELANNHRSLMIWHQLDSEFKVYMRAPECVGA